MPHRASKAPSVDAEAGLMFEAAAVPKPLAEAALVAAEIVPVKVKVSPVSRAEAASAEVVPEEAEGAPES